MAKVNGREDALLNAYLNRYQTAQASNVSTGRNTTRKAQQQGSAIMNATDKTLPVLHNSYTETLNNIVQGASLENSLNNDILNRQMKLAQAKFDAANDLYQQQQKAQQYAAKKAAKAAKSSGKSSGKGGSTTGTGSDTESAVSLDSLFGGGANTGGNAAGSADTARNKGGNYDPKRTNEERNASARARYDDSKQEKSDVKYRAQQKAERTAQMLKDKQAAANAGVNKGKTSGKTYAEQKNNGNTFTKPSINVQSAKGGQANQRYAELEEEDTTRKTTEKSGQRGIGSRIADLAKGTAKQAIGAALSFLEAPAGGGSQANKAAQYEMRRLMETGQALNADGSVSDAYQKALDQFENTKNDQDVLDEKFVPALGLVKEGNAQVQRGGEGLNGAGKAAYNIAAMGANMAPGMALGLVNPAFGAGYMGLTSAGQKLSEETEKGMGSRDALLRGAASGLISTGTNAIPIGEFANITKNGSPILQGALKEGVENAGQEAADYLLNTAADYALKDPDANFSLQDMASQVGMGAATGAAFGALGGVLNRAGNRAGLLDNGQQNEAFLREEALGDAAQDALKQADNAVQDVQKSAPARNIVQPEANGTTGLAAQTQQMNTPVTENRIALDTTDELRGQVNLNGAQEKEAEQLRRALLQHQQEIGDEAKLALQNTDSLPVDAQRAAGYNEVNGGVQNDNLGAGVRADISLNADAGAGYETQPGGGRSGLAGQTGAAGPGSTASGNGAGVQGTASENAQTVAEWAKSITGKGRQSVYTRRIENLHNAMQNGASRESLSEEAAKIAAGLVKERNFAEPLDEATSALREYMKSTPIRLDEKAAGDILYTSGLKNIQQYNIQNGTKFSLTDGIPYDTAMQELGEMSVGVNGSSIDDLMRAVDASNAKPIVDSDRAAAVADYYRDFILDGPSDRQLGADDFADWLDVQSFDRDAPDYVQRLLERDNLTAIDAATDIGYNDINNIGGVTNEAVQGRNQYDGTRSEGILRGSSDGTPQSGQRLAVGAESGEYLPANRVLVAEHLNQRPSVYNDSTRAIAEQAGAGAFDFRNSDDAPETFAQALATAKANNVNGAAVDGHTAEEIANIVNNGGKTFLTPDGTAGGAVEANGNLTCVFKDAANNSTPGAGSSIALAAVNDGATKGDCYGRALVNMYSKAGLEPVARIPYAYGYNDAMDAQVRKQIADGIISKEPDVYALKLRDGYDFEKAAAEFNTAHRYTQAELDALPVYDDYDEMLAYRDSLLKAPSADAGSTAFLQPTDTASEPVPGLNIAENAQSVAKLNGSESVPAHAVGAESTQYDRREVLNQDYANQRVMRGDMDAPTAAELGIGEQTHTVYSRAEGRDTASQDFDVLVQQTGSVTGAGRTVADELNRKIQSGQWDASDVYAGSHAAEQLRQRLAELPEGSAESDVVKAQIANINRAVSAGQSKAGQALVSGRYAQPDEYSGIRRFEQYTQNSVDRFANTRQGQQLHDVAQEVADTMNGPMDDEFTAFVHSQGVDTGDDVRDQLEYMAEQIQRMGRARNVNINDEQARAAAARLQAGGTVEDIYGAFARQALGIGDLSQEDLDYAVDTFRRISDMPDSRERYDLEMSVYGRMANYMPARGFADRLNNIRYLCMLGNSRTHIRNMMGNVMMGTVTRAKDNIAGVMQLALPQNERTKAVGTMLTADGRRMVNRARDYVDNQMYSILYQDGRWNMDTGLQAARNTYATPVGRAIGRLSDINVGALEAEDNFFLRSAFGNSMASFLKARGYDSSIFDATDEHSRSVLRQAAAQALEDAREATFHEDNFLSTAFRNFSNDTRRHGPAGQIAYAVTEGILPFKKTPINIAKNALEYNPVGGAVEAIYRGATGQGATRVMDAAAKGVTGTAILGAGYLLAKNGMLTGGASGDDRADNYSEMLGDQNYAVKIPGKGTYTLDWASPSSVPLLIGAQIAKDQEDGGEFNLTQTLDRMRQITQPVLETTMLQGLNDTLDSVSYADSNDKLATLATSALGSFANQFVPTALGQVARTVDDTRRSSYGGGDTKTERDIGYNIRKMENKIPGLSKNNEPYIDQWGREEASLDGTDDSAEGMFLRGAYNMLSPGYVSAENITPVDEYLQELYDSTNDSHVLPEKASSQIKVDGEGYYMTPEEKTEYAKTSGQTAYELVDELRQNSMFLRLPEDQQSALVQDAYTVAKTAGGVAAVGDGVSGVDTKEYEAYRDGGAEGFSQYVLMKNATDLARDEKREASDNDDAKLNAVETWNTLYSQFGDDAVSNFVNSTDKGSTVRNISNLAGDKAVTAYMQAYSAVAKTLDDDQTPDKFTVGYGMQKYGLSGDDFARAYLAAYYKKDKNGKYPEKGGSYADKAGAEIYQSYGADALRDWVNYRATIPDTNGNGKADKDEAVARLKEMDLTNEMRRAYLAKTNKQWGKKNPF